MSAGEKLAAFHGNLSFGRDQVVSAQIVPTNFWPTLGLRVPGTGLPPLIISGTYIKKGDRAFVSYFKGQTPVEIKLTGARFTRLIIGVDALAAAEALTNELSPAQ
ncbi:MAG: hypothetical protein RL196_1278 [Actinomycetota bacterium]